MRARDDAFKVIASVSIGDRKAAVFEHHPHPGNRIMQSICAAATIGDPADNCHAGGQILSLDPHGCARGGAAACGIGGGRLVDSDASRGVWADRHRIGDRAALPGRNITQSQRQSAAIG